MTIADKNNKNDLIITKVKHEGLVDIFVFEKGILIFL